MAIPESNAQAAMVVAEERTITEQAAALVVNDEASLAVANAILANIARLKKNVEERRDWLVRPLNDHVKAINEWFRSVTAPLVQADTLLRNKKLAYAQEVERQRQEAERARREAEAAAAKAAAEAMAAGRTPEPAAPVFGPAAPPPVKGIRTTWTFEIEDPDQVPRQYCTPDAQLIRAAVDAGCREIPGVRIFQRQTTVERAR